MFVLYLLREVLFWGKDICLLLLLYFVEKQ